MVLVVAVVVVSRKGNGGVAGLCWATKPEKVSNVDFVLLNYFLSAAFPGRALTRSFARSRTPISSHRRRRHRGRRPWPWPKRQSAGCTRWLTLIMLPSVRSIIDHRRSSVSPRRGTTIRTKLGSVQHARARTDHSKEPRSPPLHGHCTAIPCAHACVCVPAIHQAGPRAGFASFCCCCCWPGTHRFRSSKARRAANLCASGRSTPLTRCPPPGHLTHLRGAAPSLSKRSTAEADAATNDRILPPAAE